MEPYPRNPRYEHLVFTSITLLWDFENFSAIGVKFWIWEAIQIHSQMWEMLLGKRRGRGGGVWSTTTLPLPDGEYDNQYVHYSETWRLLHLNEGLESVCGSTPLGARIEHCLAQWTVCLVFLHYNCPRIIFQDQQERWQDDIIFNGYLVLPLPPLPPPPPSPPPSPSLPSPLPLPRLLRSSKVVILGVLCLWMVHLVLFCLFSENFNFKACYCTPCLASFLGRIILIPRATNYCNCTAVCFMFLGACVG